VFLETQALHYRILELSVPLETVVIMGTLTDVGNFDL